MSSRADTVDGWTIRKISSASWFDPKTRRSRTLSGYTLIDPEGAEVMIGSHGHVCPTYRETMEERRRRIEMNRPLD
jgi:hypothetical protein